MLLVLLFLGTSLPSVGAELFTHGKYVGRPINVRTHRSIRIVEEREDVAVVEQFFHQKKFWRAEIPLDSVAVVIGQFFNFSGQDRLPINHVQVRFSLAPGKTVQLRSSKTLRAGPQLTDFVYSIEAIGPVGVAWNYPDAMRGNLVNAHRFSSLNHVVRERVIGRAYRVHQGEVALEADLRRQFLERSLKQANEAGMKQPYFIFRFDGDTTNCTALQFKTLDDIVCPVSRLDHLASRFFKALPIAPAFYLQLRGRLGKALPELGQEFAESIVAGDYGKSAARRFLRFFTETGERCDGICGKE